MPWVRTARESYVVTWQPVADAARYRVLRQLGNGAWTEVAATKDTSLTDYVPALGVSVFYRVEVYDAAGNTAPARDGDEGYTSAFWYPRAADVSGTYQGDNKILLRWTQPRNTFAIRWDTYRLFRGVGAPPVGEQSRPPSEPPNRSPTG
uniref:Fibronectin type-III domain-containing protein n=1 Tax=Streptomyces sp. NBC_00093 TaxID=2975649 RepID=A0AAU1ZZY1_9ACTN